MTAIGLLRDLYPRKATNISDLLPMGGNDETVRALILMLLEGCRRHVNGEFVDSSLMASEAHRQQR